MNSSSYQHLTPSPVGSRRSPFLRRRCRICPWKIDLRMLIGIGFASISIFAGVLDTLHRYLKPTRCLHSLIIHHLVRLTLVFKMRPPSCFYDSFGVCKCLAIKIYNHKLTRDLRTLVHTKSLETLKTITRSPYQFPPPYIHQRAC